MTPSLSKALLLAGVMTLTGVTVAAAAPPPPPPTSGPEAGPRLKHDGPRRLHRDPEARARHLRDVLQLTPQQEPALQAFLTAGKPEMRMERRERPAPDAPRPAPLTTPQRLDRQLERMAKHQEIFAKRAAATKAFYAQLTPSQQKAFDALRPAGRRDGGHRMRMFRPGGHGGGPMAMAPTEDGHLLVGAADGYAVDLAMINDVDLAMVSDEDGGEDLILDGPDF